MGRLHLLLLRHADAESAAAPGRDRDRRLTGRGRRDAELMGSFLTAADRVPDAVLTSPAARARATAELAIEAGGWRCRLREIPALYESSVERALDVLRANGSDHPTLLVVGHEPTFSDLAATLCGGGSLRLPKAAVAHLVFDLEDWSRLEPGAGVLRALVTPAHAAALAASRGSE